MSEQESIASDTFATELDVLAGLTMQGWPKWISTRIVAYVFGTISHRELLRLASHVPMSKA
jgi:hypothetical protein